MLVYENFDWFVIAITTGGRKIQISINNNRIHKPGYAVLFPVVSCNSNIFRYIIGPVEVIVEVDGNELTVVVGSIFNNHMLGN